ncbi:LysR family substrate-binding domain-containing protein [Nonomuraea sp. NPDC050691]|uniref:LysR family substrate-binding domain-containing protein n=1 Tax=Nonomuraea sp. NPDC050691 TaxID=3155661 RepID=UPI00340F6CF5
MHEAARGLERLVVTFSAGLHVSEAIRSFTARHPQVEIDLVPSLWWERDAPLRDGRAHVGYLRRPFEESGLRIIPIGHDPKVACLPVTHPLARLRTLTSADLDGEPILDARTRRTSSLEEKFELIASGRGVGLVPRSVARSSSRPDLLCLPVTDATPYETCLAVAEDRRERRVLDFLEIATTTLRRPSGSPAPQ